jgi:ferritin-like metal-binding protein YciE
MAKKVTRVGGESGLEELTIKDANDGSLGLTNVGKRKPEDWAANTGPTRTGESSGGVDFDPLRSTRKPSPKKSAASSSEAPKDLQECLVLELQDLYQAEAEQKRVLTKMAEAASAEELRSAFQDHLEETQQQSVRLAQILEMIGEVPGGSGVLPTSVAGLITESEEKTEPMQDLGLRDLFLIAEAQKMEHNEMACYGTARAMAHTLGRDQEAHLLQATLREEEQADQKLSRIALKLMKQVGTNEPPSCEVDPESRG